MINHNFSK
jgi:hypothetical protein